VEECAALADSLLRGCPTLRILATSREALGVAGERAWLVPPLTLPPPGEELSVERLLAFEAVQLFVARAQDVVPRFTLEQTNAAAVARICRRLDGLPLAVELAAARVRVLAPQQIAERLDDAFALLVSGTRTSLPRHRTLHATIDWSYRLLTEPEQLLLQRLSVFSGGLSLAAAENVGGGGALGSWDVLDLLARLVDRSLVVMEEREGEARYRLLDTVRQFAGDRLRRQDGADSEPPHHAHEIERRHALFYAVLARRPARGSTGRASWRPSRR
jgi:predicted ATPase